MATKRSSRKAASDKKDPSAGDVASDWVRDAASRKIDLFRQIALIAESMLEQEVSSKQFTYLIGLAVDARIVTPDHLSELGRVDRSTASRWIHGTSAPPTLMQEVILERIKNEAERLAEALETATQIKTRQPNKTIARGRIQRSS